MGRICANYQFEFIIASNVNRYDLFFTCDLGGQRFPRATAVPRGVGGAVVEISLPKSLSLRRPRGVG